MCIRDRHNIEQNHIINNNKYTNKIIYWHRYVDDILLLFKGNTRQVENFHKYINTIHHKLKFTLEIEQNNSINFLDLTINKTNNTHTYKIYRKPTTTDMVIHSTSNHPTQHKHAAFNHMLHRLSKILLNKQDYTDELNTIKYIAIKNGYNPNLINTLHKRIKNKNNKTQNTINTQHNKYITLTYHNSYTHKIANTFRKHKYKIAYRTTNIITKHINNTNTDIDKYNKTGVYKLNCNDCNSFYIGQTGRSFSSRYSEHLKALTNNNICLLYTSRCV